MVLSEMVLKSLLCSENPRTSGQQLGGLLLNTLGSVLLIVGAGPGGAWLMADDDTEMG
jgi:hypothetical protein